ncbi:GTPase HflX [Ornithinibacillus halotolerans]|uniref:GTPase HflX n=1 Tax=Ornithinibacillus halotolerans TaxID=1274357 RepID=A0A916W2Z2_9BACI|nr:GTPase HflX [Ornithinibacillus halotolerans]GGA62380.1 GTPase HflX [Ornithinibacillus halotolerans]
MAEEKIIVIAVKKPDEQDEYFTSSLEELISLADTAGGKVVATITQNRNRIHPAFYIGEGKMEEIKEKIDELDVDLVISNDELSAGQSRNLSDFFDRRVIDRSQLILDIFAARAKTKEGKLQVELAQLQYLLPRLRGQGVQLSRLGAGIGTRGPGETKLETDQRHIRNRIDDIKRRLKQVVKQRDQYRKRRKHNEVFQIAIVGYTNAGKSTLFNRLTGSDSLEENKLFATLDPLTRKIQLPSGFQILLTDTVGFIQKLPTTLIAAFRSTLEEVSEADFILHVVDSSHPDNEQHQDTVLKLLDELGSSSIPVLTVYNKKDRINDEFIPLHQPSIMISALEYEDLTKLVGKIEEVLILHWERYQIHLDLHEGDLLNRFEHETILYENEFDEERETFKISGYIRQYHPLQGIVKEKS